MKTTFAVSERISSIFTAPISTPNSFSKAIDTLVRDSSSFLVPFIALSHRFSSLDILSFIVFLLIDDTFFFQIKKEMSKIKFI